MKEMCLTNRKVLPHTRGWIFYIPHFEYLKLARLSSVAPDVNDDDDGPSLSLTLLTATTKCCCRTLLPAMETNRLQLLNGSGMDGATV